MYESDAEEDLYDLEGDMYAEYVQDEDKRHTRQADRRQRMWEAMTGEEVESTSKYEVDELDQTWMKKFVAFVTDQSKKMNAGREMISSENIRKMEEGEILKGMAGGSQSKTSKHYKDGLVRILGYLQDQMIKTQSGTL